MAGKHLRGADYKEEPGDLGATVAEVTLCMHWSSSCGLNECHLSLLWAKPTFPNSLLLPPAWASPSPQQPGMPTSLLFFLFAGLSCLSHPHCPLHKSHPSFKAQIKCDFIPVTSSDCHLPTPTKSWKLLDVPLNTKHFVYVLLHVPPSLV